MKANTNKRKDPWCFPTIYRTSGRPAWKPKTHWSLPLFVFQTSWTLRQSEAVSSLQGEGGGERRSVDLLLPDVGNSEICWRISQSDTGQHQGGLNRRGRESHRGGATDHSHRTEPHSLPQGTGDRPFTTAMQPQKKVDRFAFN